MGKLHYQDPPSEKEKKAFSKYLAEDEELILSTGLGKAHLRSKFILAVAWPGSIFLLIGTALAYFLSFNPGIGLLTGLLFALILALFSTLHLLHAHRYLLTTRRVIIKTGVFAVQITSALFDKITHIEVDQSFFDRFFMKHGNIIINTAGMNKGEITIKYIDYPIEFKNLLERLINKERLQFGSRVGPVETIEGEVV